MAGRLDLDLYNVLLGFGWVRERVELVRATADHRLLRGPSFYDLFIDRSRWPELIREGYHRAGAALDAFRARRAVRA